MMATSELHSSAEGRTESEFWDSPPRYSTTSTLPLPPLSLPPVPQPSLARLIFARFLFVVILFAALAPLGYAAAVQLGWLR
jgi:hypothetical protein